MSRPAGVSEPAARPRHVLVAPDPAVAATLASAFESSVVHTFAEWAAAPPSDATVVLTGFDGPGLVAALEVARARSGPELLLDVGGPVGALLLSEPLLRGVEVVDLVDVAGATCLSLRAADGAAVPDLTRYADRIANAVGTQTRLDAATSTAQDAARIATLQARVSALEAELAARSAGPSVAPAPPPVASSVAPTSDRRARLALFATAGLIFVAGLATAAALLTGTGYDGGLLTALIALTVANMLYAVRVARGRAAADRRADRTVERARRVSAAHADARHDEVLARMADLERQASTAAEDLALVLAATRLGAAASEGLRSAATGPAADRRPHPPTAGRPSPSTHA